MKEDMDKLKWVNFINLTQSGIALKDINKFEKTLSPIPKSLSDKYPGLKLFTGFAINIFTLRSSGNEYRIFPISLSRNCKSHDFFIIDLLVDTADLREGNFDGEDNHLLLISHLGSLLNRFNQARASNISKFQYICRFCFYNSTSRSDIDVHFATCDGHARDYRGRRKSENQIVHSKFIRNKFTNKLEINGLRFRHGDSHTTLKSLAFVMLDFEQYNRNIDNVKQSGIPSGTIFTQTPMSFSYVFKSMYKNHEIPSELALPRFKRIDDSDPVDGEKNFFLSLLLNLRKDLILHHKWMNSIFALDSGVPKTSQRSMKDLRKMASTARCEICSKKFGSVVKIEEKSITGEKITRSYKIKKTYDHSHLVNDPNEPVFPANGAKLRAVLCQVTDLAVCGGIYMLLCRSAGRYIVDKRKKKCRILVIILR